MNVRRLKVLKVLQVMAHVSRDILIGKAAAVIGGWVLKNAIAMTIVIEKAQVHHTTPDKLSNRKFIRDNNLHFESLVTAFVPFLVLLTFSASLGYWAQQGGWGGIVRQDASLTRGIAKIQRDATGAYSTVASLASSTVQVVGAEALTGAGAALEDGIQHGVSGISSLISSREGALSLKEMDNFYKVALAFIPAWAYKDFIETVLVVLTIYAEPALIFCAGGVPGIFTSNSTDGSSAASAAAPAEENAGEGESDPNVVEEMDQTDQETDQIYKQARAMVENEYDPRNELLQEGKSDLNVVKEMDQTDPDVATGGSGQRAQKQPKGWAVTLWNMSLALFFTGLAAVLQLHAQTWAENVGEGRYDYLKVVLTYLQTCMFLGTGYTFWNVINTAVFQGSIRNWFWLTVDSASVTACVILAQKLLRKWASAATDGSYLQRGYQFMDKSGNFVMAWAWQAWLNRMFFLLSAVILGRDSAIFLKDETCADPMHFAHYGLSAFTISLFGVLLVTLIEVVELGQEIQGTVTLIMGMNAGWAWLGTINAFFKCDVQLSIWMYWRYAIVTVLVVVVVCFLMELASHKVDQWILQMFGAKIGETSGDADSHFESTEDSEDSEDDWDEESSDSFKDPNQKSPETPPARSALHLLLPSLIVTTSSE